MSEGLVESKKLYFFIQKWNLRPAKMKLKICGGFRMIEGGVVYARIQALISTLRNRGMNVFSQLRDLFSLCLTSLA